MKFRRVDQRAVLGAEGRTGRLCLPCPGANSPVLLPGKLWTGKNWNAGDEQNNSKTVEKSYGGEYCFARTRKVLCGGVNEAGRMRHKQITEKNS